MNSNATFNHLHFIKNNNVFSKMPSKSKCNQSDRLLILSAHVYRLNDFFL